MLAETKSTARKPGAFEGRGQESGRSEVAENGTIPRTSRGHWADRSISCGPLVAASVTIPWTSWAVGRGFFRQMVAASVTIPWTSQGIRWT